MAQPPMIDSYKIKSCPGPTYLCSTAYDYVDKDISSGLLNHKGGELP